MVRVIRNRTHALCSLIAASFPIGKDDQKPRSVFTSVLKLTVRTFTFCVFLSQSFCDACGDLCCVGYTGGSTAELRARWFDEAEEDFAECKYQEMLL
jgi:hypothetical protein